jgi:hypothetical protein
MGDEYPQFPNPPVLMTGYNDTKERLEQQEHCVHVYFIVYTKTYISNWSHFQICPGFDRREDKLIEASKMHRKNNKY